MNKDKLGNIVTKKLPRYKERDRERDRTTTRTRKRNKIYIRENCSSGSSITFFLF